MFQMDKRHFSHLYIPPRDTIVLKLHGLIVPIKIITVDKYTFGNTAHSPSGITDVLTV